ncbi:MAG: hypothetical protein ACOX67_07440 [Oscillospiraceae bacterium]|uniref:hypothetical protein n=1 Tax=Candidatus Pseudoscillospira sp. SGI.172 TaxID=3420582 RepID=UPI0009B9942B|nr:hypothetical protein [Pseudoflavonifractor sp.]MDY3019983.1 hypothetical protein [Oscillospiraceae bacterium]
MDTVYYNLTARRVRVSGGPDLLKFSPAPAEAPAGEVLDFQRCRRKLETKAALAQLREAEEESRDSETEESEVSFPGLRRERAAGWLELCASLSVIAVSAAAVAAFLITI